jgi:hypothetical protein
MRHAWPIVISLLASTSVVHAQRYRVLVGEAGSARVSLIEFRPCVPAETSDCGAWLVQAFDTSVDSAMRPGPGARQVVSRRAGSIAIDGESIVITPTTRGQRPAKVSGTHGHPIALAMARDSAYVFGIFENAGGQPPELEMIDLNTGSVWAVFPLKARPAGISIAP